MIDDIQICEEGGGGRGVRSIVDVNRGKQLKFHIDN